jgi:Arc/MetJ-type ribon-helix-helix transcriptional regulator
MTRGRGRPRWTTEKRVRLGFFVSERQAQALDAYAEQGQHRSRSEALRALLESLTCDD